MTQAAETGRREMRLSWLAVAWLGALLLISYAPVLWRLVRQWDADPDMGHGFFVPIVAGFILWQNRQLSARKPMPGPRLMPGSFI